MTDREKKIAGIPRHGHKVNEKKQVTIRRLIVWSLSKGTAQNASYILNLSKSNRCRDLQIGEEFNK